MALPVDLTNPETYPLLPGLAFFAKKSATEGDDDDMFDDTDDDSDDDDTDDDTDGDDDEDSDDDDEEQTPEQLKASNARMAKALAKANAEAKKHRLKAAALKGKKGTKKDGDDDEDEEEKAAKLSAPALKIAKTATAKSALKEAGLVVGEDSAASFKRALKLLDLDELDIDEDGDVDGLADAIVELKEEFPGMFAKPRRAKRSINGTTDDKGGKAPTKRKLTASEAQAEALVPGSVLGKARR